MRLYAAFVGLIIVAMAALALFALLAKDAPYTLSSWLSFGRYDAYDSEIAVSSARNNVDPLLVKAVVWQESRFRSDMLGGSGERGLMQITEAAARDWAEAKGVETFVPADLLDPKTNVEVGSWYLGQALQHWSGQEDPLPFALGEYNAGRSRVKKWSGGTKISADELERAMDIPSTKAYVAAVRKRYEYYKSLKPPAK